MLQEKSDTKSREAKGGIAFPVETLTDKSGVAAEEGGEMPEVEQKLRLKEGMRNVIMHGSSQE